MKGIINFLKEELEKNCENLKTNMKKWYEFLIIELPQQVIKNLIQFFIETDSEYHFWTISLLSKELTKLVILVNIYILCFFFTASAVVLFFIKTYNFYVPVFKVIFKVCIYFLFLLKIFIRFLKTNYNITAEFIDKFLYKRH